ncbi:molybdopterin-dependent oxidoreductase [Rhizohabitans arisaemae]|uniref:molybdopterin-dependent oxidoreductase n=1 Tax=Rhizohabitans arisaemae TaxID=2720610 RepID=UPI0024B255E9|nr:molybdopterin-dependent oxidoreductase [Rhizohabitans arisaemae]
MRMRWAGPVIGVVAGAVAIGVAQLFAGLLNPRAFPVIAVGDTVIDLTPAQIKDWAIATFGVYDKVVLLGGIAVLLTGFAALIGAAARRKAGYGLAGVGLFAAVGIAAVLARPDTALFDVLPTVFGGIAGAVALLVLLRRADPRHAPARPGPEEILSGAEPAPAPEAESMIVPDRRRLLTGLAVGVGVAGVAGALGRAISGRMEVGEARTALTLPKPTVPLAPLPAGVDFKVPGLSPFVTPNKDFYRIDTALFVPQVSPSDWRLRIHGLVDRPVELTLDDLMRRKLVEADVTLCCVSNEVGGPLIGNARWLGVPMADVLRDVGIQAGADMLLSRSADGWTCGPPVDVVMDGRNALFAIGMNGEALPVDHGFPVRQVVPGLYGYVSATKWVVDIKVTRFADDQGYWTPRGWSAKGPVKTQSRIDVPKLGEKVKAGKVTVAGVAWAQHRGIEAVEVRIDQGSWHQARLAEVPGLDTWRQWSYDWDATRGRHRIEVRATDKEGHTQPEERTPVAPDGATGWHGVIVEVV